MILSHLGKLWRDRTGSPAVEFALAAPVLIMLTLAALQFGRVLQAHAGLQELAGRAGRDAIVANPSESGVVLTDDQIEDKVETDIEALGNAGGYNLENGTLAVNATIDPDTTLLIAKRARIQITYAYPFSVPLLGERTINMSVDRTFFIPE